MSTGGTGCRSCALLISGLVALFGRAPWEDYKIAGEKAHGFR